MTNGHSSVRKPKAAETAQSPATPTGRPEDGGQECARTVPNGNLKQFRACSRCNQPAASEEPDAAGSTLICMLCGHSQHLDRKGNPHVPEVNDGRLRKEIRRQSIPKQIRTTRLRVRQHVRGHHRGRVDWELEDAPEYRVAVNYRPGHSAAAKWKIHSAETDPPLPPDLEEADLKRLKQVLRDAIQAILEEERGPDAAVQSDCNSWEVHPWGSLARSIVDGTTWV